MLIPSQPASPSRLRRGGAPLLPKGEEGPGSLAGDGLHTALRLAADGLVSVAAGQHLVASSCSEAYGRLFGRDSLITSLQFLSAARLDPCLASLLLPPVERTLRALATFQGVMDDPWTEEEPGKILHEYNESSGGDFPGAYYASVDSTPLFLIALHQYDAARRAVGWVDGETGRRGEPGTEHPRLGARDTAVSARHPALGTHHLLEELRDARNRALAWILERADLDGDGLVEFLQRNPERKSLINQNWKDSRDSLLAADGSAPLYPVAYSEVQAYCYRAVVGEAELRAEEDPEGAARLLAWANRLASTFERRFWMPDAGCYAQALDARKRQLTDVASNAFHWLWMGPLRPRRFRRAADRLLAADLFTPFGLRTLSSSSGNYAPLRYHRGSIWPWDNWAAASALRRLGMEERAREIDAAVLSALGTLGCPAELYVFREGDHAPSMSFLDWLGRPAHACRFQAWTVGYLVEMVARRGAGAMLLDRLPPVQSDPTRETVAARAVPAS